MSAYTYALPGLDECDFGTDAESFANDFYCVCEKDTYAIEEKEEIP